MTKQDWTSWKLSLVVSLVVQTSMNLSIRTIFPILAKKKEEIPIAENIYKFSPT